METTKRLVTYDQARFIRDPGWIRTNDTRFRRASKMFVGGLLCSSIYACFACWLGVLLSWLRWRGAVTDVGLSLGCGLFADWGYSQSEYPQSGQAVRRR